MKCANCGAEFEPTVPYQKYCSEKCRNVYYHSGKELPAREPYEFRCAHCGKVVVTAQHNDKRIKYCSRRCYERAKEKRKERRRLRGNLGLSGGMSLGSLIKRERMSSS